VVATIAAQTPRPTSGAIATHLECLDERTPPGSVRRTTSSVAVLLERERVRRLLASAYPNLSAAHGRKRHGQGQPTVKQSVARAGATEPSARLLSSGGGQT
jgi:hypothetical protein